MALALILIDGLYSVDGPSLKHDLNTKRITSSQKRILARQKKTEEVMRRLREAAIRPC